MPTRRGGYPELTCFPAGIPRVPVSVPPQETGKVEYDKKMNHEVLEVQMPVEWVFSAREGQIRRKAKTLSKWKKRKEQTPKSWAQKKWPWKQDGVNRRGSLWTLCPPVRLRINCFHSGTWHLVQNRGVLAMLAHLTSCSPCRAKVYISLCVYSLSSCYLINAPIIIYQPT